MSEADISKINEESDAEFEGTVLGQAANMDIVYEQVGHEIGRHDADNEGGGAKG